MIEKAYGTCDIYFISSMKALRRYWCIFEISLSKTAPIVYYTSAMETTVKDDYVSNLHNQMFGRYGAQSTVKDKLALLSGYHNEPKFKTYMTAIESYQNFNRYFNLKDLRITKPEDKEYINGEILKRFKTLEEYESDMNVFLYILLNSDQARGNDLSFVSAAHILSHRTYKSIYPLHFAVMNGNIDSVVKIVKNCTIINDKDNSQFEPLFYAIFKGDVKMVKLLIDNGASVCVFSNFGADPIGLAQELGHKEILLLLQKYQQFSD